MSPEKFGEGSNKLWLTYQKVYQVFLQKEYKQRDQISKIITVMRSGDLDKCGAAEVLRMFRFSNHFRVRGARISDALSMWYKINRDIQNIFIKKLSWWITSLPQWGTLWKIKWLKLVFSIKVSKKAKSIIEFVFLSLFLIVQEL